MALQVFQIAFPLDRWTSTQEGMSCVIGGMLFAQGRAEAVGIPHGL